MQITKSQSDTETIKDRLKFLHSKQLVHSTVISQTTHSTKVIYANYSFILKLVLIVIAAHGRRHGLTWVGWGPPARPLLIPLHRVRMQLLARNKTRGNEIGMSEWGWEDGWPSAYTITCFICDLNRNTDSVNLPSFLCFRCGLHRAYIPFRSLKFNCIPIIKI